MIRPRWGRCPYCGEQMIAGGHASSWFVGVAVGAFLLVVDVAAGVIHL